MTARSFLHVAHVWGNASRRAAWLERSTSNWREARRHAARRRHYEIAALNMLKGAAARRRISQQALSDFSAYMMNGTMHASSR